MERYLETSKDLQVNNLEESQPDDQFAMADFTGSAINYGVIDVEDY